MAVAIDPVLGDEDWFIQEAEKQDVKITHVIDTHVHADHYSGGRVLAEKAGAAYCLHEANAGRVNFPFEPLQDGQRIDVGNVYLDVQHTPGRTPDSVCLLVTDKPDLALGDQRGLAIGMNAFAGYVGVAVAGIVTAYLAEMLGARQGLLLFGLAAVGAAGAATLLWVEETLPRARLEAAMHATEHATRTGPRARYLQNVSAKPGTWEMFTLMSWRDRRLAAFCQAGLVEKFVDAWMWVIAPVWLYRRGMTLPQVGQALETVIVG